MRGILIVDDNAMNRLLLKNVLKDDYAVMEAENGSEALNLMLQNYEILSAVLLDIVMPDMDGYEVLRRSRDNMRLAQIPIIVVTGSEDEESRVKALSLGANDFIQKPFNPDIVKHCLKNNIALRETASILNAIRLDKLTGLFNREAFFEKASAAIKNAENGYYVLSCFDIDNFKLINDQYGATEGDRILREIGQAVKRNMDEIGGIAGRISADNFAALFPYQKRETDILQRIQDKKLVTLEHRAIAFSVGRHIITDPSLPASAQYDRAYIAKQSIKGRYDTHLAYFNDTMLERLVRDQLISGNMEAALSGHQFEVWFQPQHNHATGALVGAEALVRWRHPEEGLIPPNEFIPVFEKNGFVYELDKYVWEETCRCLRKWSDEGRDPLPVSVNLSRYDVYRTDILDVLAGLIAKYDIPASMLRLEITESAFAQSTQTIVSIVKELISHGFTVEIDDFGSGYSSLNTLKNVPAQIVKLDMRFFEDDDGSGRGGNIIESVVRMSKWLGMSVIAEGVEEKQQADYLASIGCSYIQGFYYARPMPAADYEAYSQGAGKEARLLSMESVAQLDNNSFWSPKSMDTLIFNSFVGAACIFEYYKGNIELLRVNTKFAAILGDGTMSVEETLRLDWSKYLTSESLELFREVLRLSSQNGDEYTNEYVFVNIPGGPVKTYLRATMRVIATTEQQMLVYCACENITAQRQAENNERNAKESELAAKERLQLVLENIDSSVQATVFEASGARVVFANDKYYEQLGYTREQYERDKPDPFSFIHPKDRAHAIEISTRNNATREPYSLTYRLIRRDGSLIWHQSRISFIDFPGERLPVQLSVASDITALKESELQNAAVTGQLKAVMDNVGCGITAIIYNGDAVEYLMINDRYYEMLGYTKAEYHRLKDFSPICEEDRQRTIDISRQVYNFGGTANVECRATKADGSMIWLRYSVTMTRFAGVDKPVQLAIFSDITTERAATQELMDNLPGGAALYEYDGEKLVPVYINKRYWELVGRSPIDYAGNSVISAVHPDDKPMVLKAFREAMRTGSGVSIDLRARYGQNEYRMLHFDGRLIRKPNGKFAVYASYSTLSD